MTTPDLTAPSVPAVREIDLSPSSRRLGEWFIRVILGLARSVSVVTTVGIVVSLLLPAIEFFSEISPIDFFTGTNWSPLFEPGPLRRPAARSRRRSSSRSGRCSSRSPCGLGTAIFLSEYASPRARNILKPILEILAAIPTVVYGYFALTAVTPLLRVDRRPGRDLQRAGGRPRDRRDAHPDDRLALGGRDVRRAAGAAGRRLRAGRRPAAGLDPRRRSGGDLGDHRLVRARHLARGRRDDDRAHRRRAAGAAHASTRARRWRR